MNLLAEDLSDRLRSLQWPEQLLPPISLTIQRGTVVNLDTLMPQVAAHGEIFHCFFFYFFSALYPLCNGLEI